MSQHAKEKRMATKIPQAFEDRFWSKVDKGPGCWNWKASGNGRGYGSIGLNGKTTYAHRISYEMENGPIPDGLQIDHLCRNRACVNPAHLEAVSCRTNCIRGESKASKNAAKTHCKNGHPFNGGNVYITPAGGRNCRTCRRDWMRERNRGTVLLIARLKVEIVNLKLQLKNKPEPEITPAPAPEPK